MNQKPPTRIPTFEGTVTGFTTSFDEAGKSDFRELGRHVAFLVKNHVHLILPGGSTGQHGGRSIQCVNVGWEPTGAPAGLGTFRVDVD